MAKKPLRALLIAMPAVGDDADFARIPDRGRAGPCYDRTVAPPDPGPSLLKLTYEDYLALPQDGKRHEIIDGEHYVTPSPTSRHQSALGNLHLAIGNYLREHPLGKLFLAPLDVILSNFDVVEPDLLFISNAKLEILTGGYVHGAPDLVVEILSPSTLRHDAITKRRLYGKFGVFEYWLVDPEREQVEVYRLTGGSLEKVLELTLERGETLSTPLLPGFSLPLDEIFAY